MRTSGISTKLRMCSKPIIPLPMIAYLSKGAPAFERSAIGIFEIGTM
jgi:hypothetical protein